MQYIVYAIGKYEDLKEPYDGCYIGVTHRPEKRWKEHARSKRKVGQYIRENILTYEQNMIILFHGSCEECYCYELTLRPVADMGLNEAIGGLGGYKIPHTEETKQKISKAHKGRKTPWIHKTIANRKTYEGSENPHAKKWLLTSPDGMMYNVTGNLSKFCEEHQILLSCIRYYEGQNVPPTTNNKYGGYRAKNEKSRKLRENSTGWKLDIMEK